MTKELKALLEKRAALAKQLGDTLNTIEAEKRDNKPEETELMNKLNLDISDLNTMIEAREKLNIIDTAGFKPTKDLQDETATEYRTAFSNYLRGKGTSNDLKELRAMTSGTATAGAELVPDEFKKQILDAMLEYGILLGEAEIITTAENGDLIVPTSDDTANSGVWTAEGGTITPADFATGSKTMKAYKIATAIEVSSEFLEDAFIDVDAHISKALGIRLARTFESAFINGDGTGKPLGIIADTDTKALTSAVIDVVDDDDALALIAAIQPSARKGAKYYASDSMLMAMAGWKDTTGRPLLQTASDATVANGLVYTLHGYPVVPNYELGDATTGGEVPLLFGNPKNYWVRMVRSLKVQRGDEVNMLSDEVVFVATTRLDGKLMTANDGFAKMTVKAV